MIVEDPDVDPSARMRKVVVRFTLVLYLGGQAIECKSCDLAVIAVFSHNSWKSLPFGD